MIINDAAVLVVTTRAMELPNDAFKTFRKPQKLPPCSMPDDALDLSKVNFSDDETWLYDCPTLQPPDLEAPKARQSIDTRTFTRPKKRYARPSLEKYNREISGLLDSGVHLNGSSLNNSPPRPVFDLEQSVSSVYFDNILSNAPMKDSFLSTSPPSLVNSMCSSVFGNLMESSFIKNDPILREIRDTDYTGVILQQEEEPSYQSITGSYSSLNSDVPENFLKKCSFTEDQTTIIQDATVTEQNVNDTVVLSDDLQGANLTFVNINCTYQQKPKSTNDVALNSTFQRRRPEETFNKSLEEKTIENVKRLLDRRPSPSLDLNRTSYIVNNEQTYDNVKRHSLGSTDSGEHLEYMSISSSSGKSSKMQSREALNDIYDQNRIETFTKKAINMHQIMSTPLSKKATAALQNLHISPISNCNSDPELSTNEEPETNIRKQRSAENILDTSPILKNRNALRGSQTNLRQPMRNAPKTNLNSMGHTLKGSYTSLRPTNTNLPVAPPPLVAAEKAAPVQAVSNTQVRSQLPRSGLPRPVTGIPTRIPGPRSVRAVSKSAGQGRR